MQLICLFLVIKIRDFVNFPHIIKQTMDSFQRSREKPYHKQTTNNNKEQWEVEVRNLPDHIAKDDIAYYLFKSLQSCNALVRHGSPITQTTLMPDRVIRINFRTQLEAMNCLLLDHIYYGKKVLFITSRFLSPNKNKNFNFEKLKIVKSEVVNQFRQLYVGNLPFMTSMEILNYLSEFGELKSFIDDTKDSTSSGCFCQYVNDEQTQDALKKLQTSKLKGRSIIVKRATLMKSKQVNKTRITKIAKQTRFESLDEMYMTFDTEGYFRNKKISCVLLLKGIIPPNVSTQSVLKDIRSQVQKIGPLVRISFKNQNVYIQYQRVEYSQIAYLLISKRKFDGKEIQVLFYDPIKFADDILI